MLLKNYLLRKPKGGALCSVDSVWHNLIELNCNIFVLLDFFIIAVRV